MSDGSAIYDVVVIGGGVNGTGTARDCSMRGLKTALVEKRDVASGASGANSGMIHGGIRYLQTEPKVTKLSCIDSGYIQRIAPHLLFRIPFIFPVPRKGAEPSLLERAYLYGAEVLFSMYDDYQPYKRGKPSSRLTADETLALEPGIRPDIVGAVTTDEWGIDPQRLCAANALSAREHGADVFLYTQVVGFARGPGGAIAGVEVRRDGKSSLLRGRLVLNASGPWSPRVAALAGVTVKLRPGKGVHLTLDRRLSNYGVICNAVDGRQIFVYPHEQSSVIGTTDDDYYGDPDRIPITHDEVEYLLQGIESIFPTVRQARILRAWAGVRPTIYKYGANEDALSREHELIDHSRDGAPGLYSIIGGKLASYRIISEEITDALCRALGRSAPCRTHLEPLPGGEATPDVAELAREHGFPEWSADRCVYRHGKLAERILASAHDEPWLRGTLCECEQVSYAEAVYALRHEMVRTLSDLRRRCRVGMGPCQGASCAGAAAQLLARERGLSPAECRRELHDFLAARLSGQRPVLAGAGMAELELTRGAYREAAEPLPSAGRGPPA
ncbi:MAG TPA: FAD-dependent oxidoreductase [Myxococcales bacterium]|nr:FAD-dependent oxidoreductase [Myxococcales bacterium]